MMLSGARSPACLSRLLWTKSFTAETSQQAETASLIAAKESKVAQYSPEQAAAMANKQRHITGTGIFPRLGSTTPMTFASSKAFSTGPAVAAVAAEEPAKNKGFLGKMMAVRR